MTTTFHTLTPSRTHACALALCSLVACLASPSSNSVQRPAELLPRRPNETTGDFEIATGTSFHAVTFTEDRFFGVHEDGRVVAADVGPAVGAGACEREFTSLGYPGQGTSALLRATCSASFLGDFGSTLRVCSVSGAGHVQCLGSNANGSLVAGRAGVLEDWTPIAPEPSAASSMSCTSTCSYDSDGFVDCRGENFDAEGHSFSRVYLSGVGVAASAPQAEGCAGAEFHCVLVDGRVWCWGFNRSGEVPVRATPIDPMEVRTSAVDGILHASMLACGPSAACALDGSRRAVCWGWLGAHGASGRTASYSFDDDVVKLALSHGRVCAVLRSGVVSCHRRAGGNEASASRYSLGDLALRSLYVGEGWVCGLTDRGSLACLRDSLCFHPLENR